jgi:hypothetical protein
MSVGNWLRQQFIHECAQIIAEHADMISDASRTGNEAAARAHFECIRLAAKDLDKTLREIERQIAKPKAKAKEAA